MSDPLSEQTLRPIYGAEKASAIRQYLQDFEQFKVNFPQQVPTIREANGRKLLLLTAPVAIPRPNGTKTMITLGLLFTAQFPEHPPHCAIMLQSGQRLVPNHPLVASNGVVRLPQLPFLREQPHPSLCDILFAVTEAFENDFPLTVGDGASPAASSSASPTGSWNNRDPAGSSPAQAQNYGQQQTPVSTGQGSASNGSPQQPRYVDPNTAPPAPPPQIPPQYQQPNSSPPPPPQRSFSPPPRVKEAQLMEKVLLDLRLKGEEHIKFRKEALAHLEGLQNAVQSQQKATEALIERKQTLLTTAPEMHRVSEMVKEWRETKAMTSASSCVVPVDDLHAHALELLAQNHAADDVMDLLERKLKKGFISCDDYLKAVSDIARQQFIARLLLKRTQARISADQNSRQLARKFPTLDPQMITEILKTSDYDVGETERRLTELTTT